MGRSRESQEEEEAEEDELRDWIHWKKEIGEREKKKTEREIWISYLLPELRFKTDSDEKKRE